MTGNYFSYKQANIHYTCTGSGEKVLLAFHGFGQNKSHYQHLATQLSGQYTVYAFDLFYHGQSFWPLKDSPLTKKFWTALITAFLQEKKILRFSLMGFSMGGKFVLTTLESFPEQISELILIAPDGIKTNFWYNLAVYPSWTKKYFRRLVTSPDAFFNLAITIHKLRLADKGMIRFAQSQMDTPEKRLKVYNTWMLCRELKFDISQIAALVNQYQISTIMFLGVHDRIITKKNMYGFLRKLRHYQLIMLKTGHNRLIDEVTAYYTQHGFTER